LGCLWRKTAVKINFGFRSHFGSSCGTLISSAHF
jgi:hypothetical protein